MEAKKAYREFLKRWRKNNLCEPSNETVWSAAIRFMKAGKTVRSKRAVQHYKVQSERSCGNCLAQIDSSVDCRGCHGYLKWISQITQEET